MKYSTNIWCTAVGGADKDTTGFSRLFSNNFHTFNCKNKQIQKNKKKNKYKTFPPPPAEMVYI